MPSRRGFTRQPADHVELRRRAGRVLHLLQIVIAVRAPGELRRLAQRIGQHLHATVGRIERLPPQEKQQREVAA